MAAIEYRTIPAAALVKPEPFHIEIPEQQLKDFKALLKLSTIPAPTYETLQEDGRFGVSHKWLTESKKYWEEQFDWRKSEAHINSFPNFVSKVKVENEEFNVHFVALFSEKPDAIPLALFHGWPGNFLEFLPIFTILKQKYTPKTLPYHLIVPSLPGYTFSSTPPLGRDFVMADICKVMNQLMTDLGFGAGYVSQGGDIGSRVARTLATEYEACKAVHINFAPVLAQPEGLSDSPLTEYEKKGLKRGEEFITTGHAYAMEQRTRPGTLGLVLGSSPLALLGWIGEKFLAWSDVEPSLDEILQSVTLYWFTESMGRGIYPYREERFLKVKYIEKPLGYSNFPQEITPTPLSWVKKAIGNVVFYKEHTKGGHFAALEQPELLLADLEEFIGQVWKNSG